MGGIGISPAVLRWALNRSTRRSEIEERFPKLIRWLNGQDRPTLRELEQLARATSTPLGYFFLPEPPEERLPIPYFRTSNSQVALPPSPDLLETMQMMQRRQEWMREYLIEQGAERLAFVGSAGVKDGPGELAQDMRQALGLNKEWAARQTTWTEALRKLQKSMEEAGILVVINGIVGNNTHRKLDVSEFRGFVLVDEYAPLVFVNGADGKAAQMFTLAHELAHLWFGRSAVFDLRELQPANDEIEQACNRVAAEFLVPASELHEKWASIRHEDNPYQQAARQFKVSELVIARRALDLSLITRDEFLEFYQTYRDSEYRTAAQSYGGGDFYATQNVRIGLRFARAVVRATREGRLLYREAYQLTGLYGKTFAQYAQLLDSGGL